MANAGGRHSGIGGVLRAVLRLVLLVGLGFGSGLLIGVVTEEPELLLGHLQGESEAVPLAPLAAGGGARGGDDGFEGNPLAGAHSEESAKRKENGAPRGPSPDRTVASGETDATPAAARLAREPVRADTSDADPRPAVSARPPGGEGSSGRGVWAIQVGAFSAREAADRLAGELADKDYPVVVLPDEGGARRWRVRVQPVEGEAEAQEVAARLKREERLPTWVLSVEGRSRR